jgi:hypothetical protein
MSIAIDTFHHGTTSPVASRWSMCLCRPCWAKVIILGWCISNAGADQAREMPTLDFPKEGPVGPDTYSPDATLTTCTLLSPYPAAASLPFNPSVEDAKDFCSDRINCGGFVYMTAQANLANSAPNLATASYCTPRTFVTGSMAATSAVGFVRNVYSSCDIRVSLSSSTTTHYGALAFTREACVKPGRGLSTAYDRTPKPVTRQYDGHTPPKPKVTVSSVKYEVGTQVFVSIGAAQNMSADGSYHTMITDQGITYYMPGATHATHDRAEIAFARDGWYPLYTTQAGAQQASIRAGGNGQAHEVGPNSAGALPSMWLTEPHVQIHWMPSNGPYRLYTGDYVAPFALDGYYPLYRNKVDAQKASTTHQCQSHGPRSSTGHPLTWSTGVEQIFYMPTGGVTAYYGTYYDSAESSAPLYSHAASLEPSSTTGQSLNSATAAEIAAFDALNFSVPATVAAQLILSQAPDYAR